MALKEKLACFLLYFLLCFLTVPASNQIIQIHWTFIITGLLPFVISLSCSAMLAIVLPKHFPCCGIGVVLGCRIAEFRSWRRKRSDRRTQSTRPSCISRVKVLPQVIPVLNRAGHGSQSPSPSTQALWDCTALSYRWEFASCMQTRVSPAFPGTHLIYWNKTLPPYCLQTISKEV